MRRICTNPRSQNTDCCWPPSLSRACVLSCNCLDFFPPCDATRMQPSKQRSALGRRLTPATRHPRRIYLPSCETACNLFSPSRKVSEPAGCLLLRKHTLNSQPGWGRRVILILTPSFNRRRDGRMHDGDDAWTALEQVDSPSGPGTCGRGERLIQEARGGHFILMLHSTAVGELYWCRPHCGGVGHRGLKVSALATPG